MDYKNIVIIVCYAAASIMNFLISAKVFKTMLHYAGVTQSEMTQFMSQQHYPSTAGKNSMHRNSIQRRKRAAMLNYLLEHTRRPDETRWLSALYEKSSLPIGISMLLLMAGLMLRKQIIIFIGIAVYLIGNIVVLAMLASFKKRNPLTASEEEMLEAKLTNENNKRLIPAKAFVIIASIIPVIAMAFVIGNVGKAINIGGRPPEEPSWVQEATAPNEPDKFGIAAFLSERGFWTKDQRPFKHDFKADKLNNAIASRKDNNSFECYEYSDEDSAKALFSELITNYGAQDKIIDENHLVIDNEKEFVFISREGNSVVYAYSYDGAADIKEALSVCGIYHFE